MSDENLSQSKVRICIGCSEKERPAAEVCAHTIREHVSGECEVMYLYEHVHPLPTITRSDAKPRTAFSYQRFEIPRICGYQGRAIYLDSDMILFADPREMFDATMPDGVNVLSACPIGKPHQNSSVMVIDCEKVQWQLASIISRINQGAITYGEMMRLEKIGVKWAPIDHQWNCLESWTPETKLLHYTDMGRQPWLPGKEKANPLGHLWFAARDRMLAAQKTQ